MKYEDVKRKLVVEAGIIGVSLVVLTGLAYFLDVLNESVRQEKIQMETQLATVTNEKQTLQNKYEKIKKNIDLYREVANKYAADGLAINRQTLRKKINDFKSLYFLNDLTLSMGPIQDMTGDKYRNNSSQIVSSELTANFDALTDADIYAMIQAFQEEFPGSVKLTKFSITRVSKVTDDSLRTIAKTGQYSMVKGDMKFTWFGIKPQESTTKPAADGDKKP